ncbi:MAG: uroporphyrinogen decarboxylase family protein [Candidatus Latescibacterota bacterium]
MNDRERFVATMHYQKVDRPVLWEWAPWQETNRRWQQEGGFEGDAPEYLECDKKEGAGVRFDLFPPFERQVIQDDGRTITYLNEKGQLLRDFHDYEQSMPEFIDYPVKNRSDWERIKERMDPYSPERYPADWDQRVARWHTDRTAPVEVYGSRDGGLFSQIREVMGAEQALFLMADDPALAHDIMEFRTEFMMRLMERALREVQPEWIILWEDMAYNTASLISPAMFREFMLPRYKRIADFALSFGVDVVFVDTDGYVDELIPLFLEAGVRGIYPMEVNSGMDVARLRKQFGRDLLMTGGVDKRALVAGPAAIDAELARIIPVALEGGYIPTLDHSLPPDISYANFQYYFRRKKEMLGIA